MINAEEHTMAKHDDDNRSNQMNPNNDAYWESRGYDGRPDDWYDSYHGGTGERPVLDYLPYDRPMRPINGY